MDEAKKKVLKDLVAAAKDMLGRIENELSGGYVSADYIAEKAGFAKSCVDGILWRVQEGEGR